MGGVVKMEKLMEDIQASIPQQAANQFSLDSVNSCMEFLVTSWSSIPIRKRSYWEDKFWCFFCNNFI